MTELDDAIREHLELKRRHGAGDAEVKQLEDEAFGAGERPADPFSAADVLLHDGQADQGGPPPAEERQAADLSEEVPGLTDAPPEGMEAPQDAGPPAPDAALPPAAGDSPIPPPPPDRNSELVNRPTEEHPSPEAAAGLVPEAAPFDEPPAAPAAVSAPKLYDFEADLDEPLQEPLEAEPFEAEPSGASGGADQFPEHEAPLEESDAFADLGPVEELNGGPPAEHGNFEEPLEYEEPLGGAGPGAVTADTDESQIIEGEPLPPTENYPYPEPAEGHEPDPGMHEDAAAEPFPEPGHPEPPVEHFEPPAERAEPSPEYLEPEEGPVEPEQGHLAPEQGHLEPDPEHGEHDPEGDDLLEETPEFLRDSPEDEDLWFEQKPPKDFDFKDKK